jgi:D-alanine-D-alanine ligase
MSLNGHLRVGVVFGGRSGEHEVSLNSAQNVIEALRRAGHHVVPIGITGEGRWLTQGSPHALLTAAAAGALTATNEPVDPGVEECAGADDDSWALLPHADQAQPLPAIDVIFPVLHGTYGEDGAVQGLLEMANLPYVGCGVLASAVAMDKAVSKLIFEQIGLRQSPYTVAKRSHWQADPDAVLAAVEAALDYPVFVKPANLGSSVGISKAATKRELAAAIDLACRYDRKIVIEEAVPNVREIEVSVLGNESPVASLPGEIVPANEFYDYAAKYLDDNSRLLIPAPLSEETLASVQEMAIQAFLAVDGEGLARVDFLLDDANGKVYLNEINTMPGFTRISMYPKLWEASGISYPQLVDRLLRLALERHQDRQQNSTSFDS